MSNRRYELGEIPTTDVASDGEWAMGQLFDLAKAWDSDVEGRVSVHTPSAQESGKPDQLRSILASLGEEPTSIFVTVRARDFEYALSEVTLQLFSRNHPNPTWDVGVSIFGDGSDAYLGGVVRMHNALKAALNERKRRQPAGSPIPNLSVFSASTGKPAGKEQSTADKSPSLQPWSATSTQPASPGLMDGPDTSMADRRKLTAWISSSWTVTIVGGIIVGLVVAAVLGLFS